MLKGVTFSWAGQVLDSVGSVCVCAQGASRNDRGECECSVGYHTFTEAVENGTAVALSCRCGSTPRPCPRFSLLSIRTRVLRHIILPPSPITGRAQPSEVTAPGAARSSLPTATGTAAPSQRTSPNASTATPARSPVGWSFFRLSTQTLPTQPELQLWARPWRRVHSTLTPISSCSAPRDTREPFARNVRGGMDASGECSDAPIVISQHDRFGIVRYMQRHRTTESDGAMLSLLRAHLQAPGVPEMPAENRKFRVLLAGAEAR